MPKQWVPPKVFLKLDADNIIYYAYKDDDVRKPLIHVYNREYYESEEHQFDVRELMGELQRTTLMPKNVNKLVKLGEQQAKDPNGRSWHKGVMRMAYELGLLTN